MSYDPTGKKTANPWLESDYVGLQKSWQQFDQELSQAGDLTVRPDNIRMPGDDEQQKRLLKQKLEPCLKAAQLLQGAFQLKEKINPVMQEFVSRWTSMQTDQKPIQGIEPLAVKLRRLIVELDAKMRELADSELPDPSILVVDDTERTNASRQNFSRWTKSLALQAAQIPWDLFSAGEEAVSVLPALEPTALEADRYRSEIHPWISLQALLRGSPGLLRGYPPGDVKGIRAAWLEARDACFDFHAGNADAANRFTAAMERFTSRVRTLAEKIEPDRQQLPIVERDRGLLSKTAYPRTLATDAEVLYNRVDPFFWSGCASLAAAAVLGLSYLVLRRTLFWTGVVVMAAGVGFVAAGFAVRVYITHWAPVTSMFETIAWVAMCISILTLWGTFLPLLGPTSKAAWRLTAFVVPPSGGGAARIPPEGGTTNIGLRGRIDHAAGAAGLRLVRGHVLSGRCGNGPGRFSSFIPARSCPARTWALRPRT